MTDDQGRFWFGDVAAGEYAVMFDKTMHEIEVEANVDPKPLELQR